MAGFITALLLTIISFVYGMELTVKLNIEFIDYDKAVNKACRIVETYSGTQCKYINKGYHYRYIKRYYKPGLYSIVKHESGNFRYNKGLYSEDYCYAQISKDNLEVLGVTEKEVLSNIKTCLENALVIWLVNIEYALRDGFRYRSFVDLMSLYHSRTPLYRIRYKRKVARIFWQHYKTF